LENLMVAKKSVDRSSEMSNPEQVTLRAIAALIKQFPYFPCREVLDQYEVLARIGLSQKQRKAISKILESATTVREFADVDQTLFEATEDCPIPWLPTILTPVFWGRNLFEPDGCLPVSLRVYYPSLDGAVQNAPMLEHCGQYPLILFLHGHCQSEDNHVYRWERMLAELARCGFVVAAPYLSTIGSGPQFEPSFDHAMSVLRWMRRRWPQRANLLPAPATGVVGHSYGGMVAARVATSTAVAAYASLSSGWHEWSTFGPTPIPLFNLAVPSFHCWGTEGLFSDAIADSDFAKIAKPKHKIVLDGGEHWVYLQGQSGGCSPGGGGCPLLAAVAGDLLAGFFARYLPPSELALTGAHIPRSLVAPEIDLTFQQQFYAGGHLSGLNTLPWSSGCRVTSAWSTVGATGSLTLGG
jgi:pimeloyl-ACP methyl ester carboxylesterase